MTAGVPPDADRTPPDADRTPTGANRPSRRLRLTVWVVAAALLALLATALVWSSGRPAGSTAVDHFDLPQLDGPGRVKLTDYRGRPVVVTLFASWCDNCRLELPAFAALARQLGPRVVFVGVNSLETGDGEAMARQFALAPSGLVLARDVGSGSSDYHDAIGARGMPATAFYNRDGRLITVDQGGLTAATLRATIRQLYGIAA